ncbi:hypothetical protein BGW38_006280 [Lunasporangiospora selenospora]|uniref:Cas1p 10 TM acyl transferase domain-containing protein n=1 Tax=Lunasporangiospora selenospora TaxID=979761 RepID=A0A9P6G3I2_9FUNG|nr:hypothetical protein BGW38_006280 [Lunasporangiospora selenospora]
MQTWPARLNRTQLLFWAISATLVVLAGLRQILDPADRTRCRSLLNEGTWVDRQNQQWYPTGCMLKTYTSPSIQSCLKGSRVVMIGDSVVRQLYNATVQKALPGIKVEGDRHSDIYVHDPLSGMEFEFYWDPVLNSTKAKDLIWPEESANRIVDRQSNKQTPTIFLVGIGIWHIRYPEWSGGRDRWHQLVQQLVKRMDDPNATSLGHNIFLSPISAVNPEKLSPERQKMLLPEEIDTMNQILFQETLETTITVPFVWSQMSGTANNATNDGLHFSLPVMSVKADIMLNFVCNNKLPKVAPMTATCCYDYPSNQWFQTLMLAFFLVWLPTGYIVQTYFRQSALAGIFPSIAVLRALSIVSAAVVFMYFSDRTTVFAKGNKINALATFFVYSILAAGCFTLKVSEKDQPFLNRDQTDEWKGWMQLIILAYHYVGASSISWIYNPVRMLVASYLFMTGFGHFVFYYKKADFGVVRVASILVRLNLLTVFLAYTMDTTYLSYYFAPLVSFFYLVIYGMMYIGHKHNHVPVFIVSKIIITAILTAVFVHVPVFLDTIFAIIHFFYGVTWSAAEWRFRLNLDVWIVFVGSLVAYLFIKAQELSVTTHPRWNIIANTATALSLVSLLFYFAYTSMTNKFEYNRHHPFISWIPIVSFVILRNSTQYLRNTTSTFFAFIGKCSLETFIGQFHMWLAGDTKGILILAPASSNSVLIILNTVVTTFIFIMVANAVAGATGELSDWLVTGREPSTKNTPALPHNRPRITPSRSYSAVPTINTPEGGKERRERQMSLSPGAKRQSVMLSPIASSAGAFTPSTLKAMMDASYAKENKSRLGSPSLTPTPLGPSASSSSSSSPSPSSSSSFSGPYSPSVTPPEKPWEMVNMTDKSTSGAASDKARDQKGRHEQPNSVAGSSKFSKKHEGVSLQIDTTQVESPELALPQPSAVRTVSALSPSEVTFKSLWAHPGWKVAIFLGVTWVLNFGSNWPTTSTVQ